MAKMRLLTFMGMAVEYKEISFDTMEQELQIGADDVEAFVIDGTNIQNFLKKKCICVCNCFFTPAAKEGPVCCLVILFAGVSFSAVRTKMVYCKIDQTQRKVVVR